MILSPEIFVFLVVNHACCKAYLWEILAWNKCGQFNENYFQVMQSYPRLFLQLKNHPFRDVKIYWIFQKSMFVKQLSALKVQWVTKVMTLASMYFLWKQGSWLLWPTVQYKCIVFTSLYFCLVVWCSDEETSPKQAVRVPPTAGSGPYCWLPIRVRRGRLPCHFGNVRQGKHCINGLRNDNFERTPSSHGRRSSQVGYSTFTYIQSRAWQTIFFPICVGTTI